MGGKMYHRLCNGLADKGTLVPLDFNLTEYIKNNQDKDLYISLYKYNANHKDKFDKDGTISGIKDNVTDHLVFDLDGKDYEQVKKDGIQLIDRLITKFNINKDGVLISYSGNKGVHIEASMDTDLDESQYKKLVSDIAVGIKSFDPKITNSSRIIRLPFTKHQISGLYKTPLSYDEFSTLSLKEVQDIAKTKYDPQLTMPKVHVPKILPIAKEVKSKNVDITTELDINFKKKPKWLSFWKYALQNGYFPEGTRSYALMVLASTYKSQGFDSTHVYYILKAAAELQAKRFGGDKFPKDEIYKTIISQVFSGTWNGGTYAEDNFPDDLKDYLTELKVPRKDEMLLDNVFRRSNDVFDVFSDFAINIDNNTLKTGISPLDKVKDLRLTTSMLVGILGSPSSGKCHGIGTEILMFDGSVKKVEDVIVGDLLMGNDSTPRTVLSLARGKEEMFKVTTNDGYYTVNRSHILSLKNTTNKISSGIPYNGICNISVHEYLGMKDHFKKRIRGYRSDVVKFPENKLDIHPYLLGSWIGDGTFTKTDISHNDLSLAPFYKELADLSNLTYDYIMYPSGKCYTHRFKRKEGIKNPLILLDEEFRTTGEKRISRRYLINSVENRRQLLAGIIDTDGYYDNKKNSYEVTFKGKELAKDLQFLCRSLGLKCTINNKIGKIASIGFEGIYYRCYISGDLTSIPIRLERKKQIKAEKATDHLSYGIKVESMGEGDYYGFELDGDHLYCLGDFTVTHNTSISLEIMRTASMSNQQVAFFSMDMGAPLVLQRLAQKVSGKTSDDLFELFKTQKYSEIEKIRSEINKQFSNVHFSFKTAMTTEGIRRSLTELQDKTGEKIRVVVIDYLECISSSISEPTAKVSLIAQELKDIATDFDTCVILLLQPPKRVGDPSKEILSYNDIKGAATVAQACSVVLSLWRDGFSPKTVDRDNYISFAAIKNRMGKLCQIDCAWNGLTGKVGDLSDIERQDLEELRRAKNNQNSNDDDF